MSHYIALLLPNICPNSNITTHGSCTNILIWFWKYGIFIFYGSMIDSSLSLCSQLQKCELWAGHRIKFSWSAGVFSPTEGTLWIGLWVSPVPESEFLIGLFWNRCFEWVEIPWVIWNSYSIFNVDLINAFITFGHHCTSSWDIWRRPL